ncbi:hypothetical protein [Albirhodobacter sp. R86504]|uniref:hypothetical protein n=1 Tax=Albirhodobacter sp. R86504 TaxID=3093848 RepID=UPI00366D881E
MAGFDPAAFWRLTPRLYLAQLEGARQRSARDRAMIAEAAWIGANVNHKGLDQYIAELQQTAPREPLPVEALAGQLARASAQVGVIRMADYLNSKR